MLVRHAAAALLAGSTFTAPATAGEAAPLPVRLDGFAIDTTGVTIGRFREFALGFNPLLPARPNPDARRRPVHPVDEPADLGAAIADLLNDPGQCKAMVREARAILAQHRGATARTVEVLARIGGR